MEQVLAPAKLGVQCLMGLSAGTMAAVALSFKLQNCFDLHQWKFDTDAFFVIE